MKRKESPTEPVRRLCCWLDTKDNRAFVVWIKERAKRLRKGGRGLKGETRVRLLSVAKWYDDWAK